MTKWSLVAEFFSLFLLAVIFLRYYCYEWKVAFTRRRKRYLACLLCAGAFILLNVACVFTIKNAALVPLWVNLLLNSGYFLFSVLTCSCYAYFLFTLILEHVYDTHCLRRAVTALIALTAAYAAVVVANLFTGVLFTFDGGVLYRRGPLNILGYAVLAAELVLLGLCYFRNRGSVSPAIVHVMRSLPPLVLLLALFQIFYPTLLLNGTLCAIASLVLFLSFQSHTNDRDSLTGLRNRNNFLTELTLRTGGRQSMHILLVSLLSLGDVNLQYGHQVGDALLYEAARYLDRLSPQGRAFRVSNLTFALTLPWTSQEAADGALRTVEARFQAPWVLGEVSVTLPFCMADLHCQEQSSADQVMEQLEFVLAQAKAQRAVVRFDGEARRRLRQKQELTAILRRSIQERRFRVWYQPLYTCRGGGFHCAEALLRLTDYQGSPVPPGVFIPLAEETGMIGELTWIVLEEVCRLLGGGEVAGLRSVSVNLSMQQLLDPRLAERIQQYLEDYGLSPERLKLEITESFLLHDAQYAKSQLSALRRMGLELHMDDFGTGYSNLSSVLNFPFSCIKFDRSLICRAPEDAQAVRMLRALAELFHEMGKCLVMEGVETAAQAACAQEAGADLIQGFYYARPMPREELAAFFAGPAQGD